MGEFLVFLAGLPSIALSAIFGALFGLVVWSARCHSEAMGVYECVEVRGWGLQLRFLSP